MSPRAISASLIALLCGISAAHAQPAPAITPEGAQALSQQIGAFLSGLLGPAVQLDGVIQVTPEGDHYRLQAPVAGVYSPPGATANPPKLTVASAPLTATAKPLDGGRWSIDDVTFPSPLKATITGGQLPANVKDAPTGLTVQVAAQHNHSVFDPTPGATTTTDGTLDGMSQSLDSPLGHNATSITHLTWHSTAQSTPNGLVNLTSEADADGYAGNQVVILPAGPPGTPGAGNGGKPTSISIAVDHIHTDFKADQFNFAQAISVIRAAALVASEADPRPRPAAPPNAGRPGRPTGPAMPPMTAAQRATMHQLVAALADLVASQDSSETLEGLHVVTGPITTRIARVTMSGGFGAPGGRADLHLKLSLQGLDIPVPGPMHDFVPRAVSLSPHISGIPKEALVRLANDAIDDQGRDPEALQGEAMQLLANGPLNVGLDAIDIDLGFAHLTGTGVVQIAGPSDMSGQALLHMTGLDALMQRMSGVPATRAAAPALIFLKGIGKQDGNETVWDVKFNNGHLTVNGTDMSALMPGGR